MSVLDVLVNKNIIATKDVNKIKEQVKISGRILDDVLAEIGVDNKAILEAYGEYYEIPTRKLENKDISFLFLSIFPRSQPLIISLFR